MRLRSILTGLFAAFAFSTPLLASGSESARLSILGFSKDGASFAYEQFGVVGPERFPYSDLQIIDTKTGLPVQGAPFRAAFSKAAPTASEARSVAYNAAARTLRRLGIGEKGTVIARGSGDPNDKASTEIPVTIDTIGSGTLVIDNFKTMSKECSSLKIPAVGLRVDIKDSSGTVLRRLVNLPKITPDLFCPLGYGLVDLRAFPREGKAPVLAMLLARTVPRPGGSERVFQAHVIDLADEALPTEEKKSGH